MMDDKKTPWTATTSDLKKALDEWATISALSKDNMPPDEQLQKDVEKLLKQLQSQIQELSKI